jgi:hypothetical protein
MKVTKSRIVRKEEVDNGIFISAETVKILDETVTELEKSWKGKPTKGPVTQGKIIRKE